MSVQRLERDSVSVDEPELRVHLPLTAGSSLLGAEARQSWRGARARSGHFDGREAFIELPHRSDLEIGRGDFTVAAWIKTDPGAGGGDVLAQWDRGSRRGFILSVGGTAGGYNSTGDQLTARLATDSGTEPTLRSCGHPNPKSNFSNSLTVFNGELYVATTDATDQADWARVFRYVSESEWEDCGRVGALRSHGVGPLLVHAGSLYAATWNHDWTRVYSEDLDACRVYRYAGGTQWEDCGQPGNSRRIVAMATFQGHLYAVGDDGGAYRQLASGREWEQVGSFPRYAHPLAMHDGRLYFGLSTPGHVYSFDGDAWRFHGNPGGADQDCTQIHSLETFNGRLHATTWPYGRVARLEADDLTWTDCGRPGDSTEINALAAYNGCFYAGTIPRAGLFRYDGVDAWQPVQDFHTPQGWTPSSALLARSDPDFFRLREWARLTSLTTFRDELFASIGSCTGSILDAPVDVRGSVQALRSGESVSADRPLGADWQHILATRTEGCLRIYIDGRIAGSSQACSTPLDLTSTASLTVGRGPTDFFPGSIRDVRVYRQALDDQGVADLYRRTRVEVLASGDDR